MMRRYPVVAIALAILLTCPALGVEGLVGQAGSMGTIAGRVTGEGGSALAGAQVRIDGTPRQALTNERGAFVITNVPAGTHTLRATAMGFSATVAHVAVAPGGTATVTLALEVSPLALEALVVQGQTGQAEAYHRQRTAPSVRNVVSAEQIERFPDAQVPDALRRIPGVSARPDRGETGYIFIRGLSPDLTTVTVDGARLPSTDRSGRGVELSSIPSEMLESIEVIKAITPDMDADAIAGVINLRMRPPTRSQFDGRIEGGGHSIANGSTTRGGLNYGNIHGPFRYTMGGDWASQARQTQNTQYSWGEWQGQEVLNRFMLQHYPIERTRYSLNSSIHYDLGEASTLFLRGFYTAYDTQEERHRIQYRLDNGTRISPTESLGARVIRQGRQYTWERRIWNLTAGGDHVLPGGLRVDYHGAVSKAGRTEPYRNYYEFRQDGVDMRLDPGADRYFPELRVTNSKSPNDLDDFRMMYYEWRLDDARDRDLIGALNVSYPLTFSRDWTGTLRAGAKVFDKTKTRDVSELTLPLLSAAGTIPMSAVGTTAFGPAITPHGYEFGPRVDWRRGQEFWAANSDLFRHDELAAALENHTEDYVAGERVAAGYLMATFELGALQLIGGGRYEHTSNDYEGKRLLVDADDTYNVNTISTASSYGSFFPALHLRYRVDEGTNLRFAATRTLARPNFVRLAPNEHVSVGESGHGVVRRGNPGLKPAYSTNLDLLAERYFGSVGVLSAGVFWKDIQDFAYTASSTIQGGELDGFELRQPRNGAGARVYGAELAVHQRLHFLPGPMGGLGVYANYTFTESEADTEYDDASGFRRTRLPEQFRHVANAAVTYDFRGFSGLLSANHQSGFIDSLRGSPEADRWGRYRNQVDASVSQRLGRNLRAVVQLNNLTNEPYIRYAGSLDTPYETEFEGTWGSIALRVDF